MLYIDEGIIEQLGATCEFLAGIGFYAKSLAFIYCNDELVDWFEELNAAWKKNYQMGSRAQKKELYVGALQNQKLNRYFLGGFVIAALQYSLAPMVVYVVKKFVLQWDSKFSMGMHLW